MDKERLKQLAGITEAPVDNIAKGGALMGQGARMLSTYSLLLIMANLLQDVATEDEVNQAKLWRTVQELQDAAKRLRT